MTPRATYRVQFTRNFTLDDGARIVPYLAALGISHLYSSPLLTARPGSSHGYDIVDHRTVNPELGGRAALERLVAALHAHDMGLLLDIVPNHMGVGGADNALWIDVLEWGRLSPYATWFDIDWEPADIRLHGKVLLPFLGRPYGEVLDAGDLVLRWNESDGSLSVWYHEHRFPIAPADYPETLLGGSAEGPTGKWRSALAESLRSRLRGARAAFRSVQQALAGAAREEATLRGEIAQSLQAFDPGAEAGRAQLHELLERQNYRLAWWRAAADDINYRRFFNINELAGFRVEVAAAFDAAHEAVFALWRDGLIDGVRIDHVDGLADPRAYCRKLRRRMETLAEHRPPGLSRQPWILVEKILAKHERLPAGWQTDGTTGYEFMDLVAGLLHDPAGDALLDQLYGEMGGSSMEFHAEEVAARRQILRDYLAAELAGVALVVHRILQRDPRRRDFTLTGIRRALAELAAHFPVYRTYVTRAGASPEDRRILRWAVAEAKRDIRPVEHPLLDVLSELLSGDDIRGWPPGAGRRDALLAVRRFQQLTGPTAAKSVEDTAFYRFVRLISRNEVGSDPGRFAIPPSVFHRWQRSRQKARRALLATGTHDQKRGEDGRMRLATLSEMPELWGATVHRWSRLNAMWKHEVDGAPAPSAADEYQLYQAMVGAWPTDLSPDDRHGLAAFVERLGGWLLKALREAKLRTDWGIGNDAYEKAALDFLRAVLDPDRSAPFAREVAALVDRLQRPALTRSLAQLAIKCLSLGVPDIYQGTELWDFSLVDPDNRRPVDFALRRGLLEEGGPIAWESEEAWRQGSVKQAVLRRLLLARRTFPTVFAQGRYRALDLAGEGAEAFIGQALECRDEAIMLVAPRFAARRSQQERRSGMAPGVVFSPPSAWIGAMAESLLGPLHCQLGRRMPLARLRDAGSPLAVLRIDLSRTEAL